KNAAAAQTLQNTIVPTIGCTLSASKIKLVRPANITDARQTVISTATKMVSFRALEFCIAASALGVIASTVHLRQLASIESWINNLTRSCSRDSQSHVKLNVMKIFRRMLVICFLGF